MWVEDEYDPIMPPFKRTKLGRPKKLRKKAPDELKSATSISRHYEQAKCGNCGAYGTKRADAKNLLNRLSLLIHPLYFVMVCSDHILISNYLSFAWLGC